MGKGGALRAGLNGRFNVGGRVSVFQILSRGSAARRVVGVGALLLTLDVIMSAAAQWLASGRRIHFSYSLRHDASDIVGLALLRVLVLPTLATVAHRSWHAVSRYSAREDGYERLNDDNELGLRKAKADLRRDLFFLERQEGFARPRASLTKVRGQRAPCAAGFLPCVVCTTVP